MDIVNFDSTATQTQPITMYQVWREGGMGEREREREREKLTCLSFLFVYFAERERERERERRVNLFVISFCLFSRLMCSNYANGMRL